MTATVGIHAPGAMGSALGRAWRAGGAHIVTTVEGRSLRTRRLAGDLALLPDLDAVVAAADVLVSVGPPGAAVAMAGAIADACRRTNAAPLVVDVNAIAPATVATVAEVVGAAGCALVDGAISGPPPGHRTTTRLYLAGPAAATVAALPVTGIDVHVVGPEPGSASAIKSCTSGVYKGFTALLMQALWTARAHGVTEQVVADLQIMFGALVDDAATRIAVGASKCDRYPAEMREIARTQGLAGADPALFEAMASVFEGVGRSELAGHTPEDAAAMTELGEVLTELTRAR